MKQETFTGETLRQALDKAKQAYGDDISVVTSRQSISGGFLNPPVFEVVVLVDENAKPASPQAPSFDLEGAIKEISQIQSQIDLPKKEAPTIQEKPNSDTKEILRSISNIDLSDMRFVREEISKITDKIKLIQNALWENTPSDRNNIVIPPEFAEIYRIAKSTNMAKEHLDEIMELTLKHMPVMMRNSSHTIRNYFRVLLRRMTPIRPEFKLIHPNKKILMLVGPTGVGKTTSLAKIAAKFAISQQYKVGIVTLDTYRIGALEQVTFYTRIMRLPIEQVSDPADFSKAINGLSHCDYILIDTAGFSQHDKEKLSKLKQFLSTESHVSIDVMLCLSANMKLEDLKESYKNFSALGIDSIVATKFDETSTFGSLFSLAYETKKPLSYFSIGQEVPEDLMVADGDYFVRCILDGFVGASK